MKKALQIVNAQNLNYNEININCGCPATTAMHGSYGLVLMKDPDVSSSKKFS